MFQPIEYAKYEVNLPKSFPELPDKMHKVFETRFKGLLDKFDDFGEFEIKTLTRLYNFSTSQLQKQPGMELSWINPLHPIQLGQLLTWLQQDKKRKELILSRLKQFNFLEEADLPRILRKVIDTWSSNVQHSLHGQMKLEELIQMYIEELKDRE